MASPWMPVTLRGIDRYRRGGSSRSCRCSSNGACTCGGSGNGSAVITQIHIRAIMLFTAFAHG